MTASNHDCLINGHDGNGLFERVEGHMVVESEHENLSLHVQLCQARYANLGGRLEKLDERLTSLEDKVSDLAQSQQAGFHDIKLLLERQNTNRQVQVIATAGTVIAALLGLIGYILTK